MRSGFWGRRAVLTACLMVGMIYAVFVLGVQAAEDNAIPQPSSAKIYGNMSEGSDIIANLIVGNVFEVVDAQNDSAGGIWYRVRTDFGAEGYVKAGELERLIAEAQAMQPPVAPENDQNGEEPAPEGNDAEGEPSPADDDAEGEPTPEDDDAGDEAVPADDDAGDEAVPADNDAGDGAMPADDDSGDGSDSGAVPEEDKTGDDPMSESGRDGQEVTGGTGSDLIEGAGFGKAVDDQSAENTTTIGNEGFTVIERTDTPKGQKHGGIDVMLIMIIAGGILCIMAIAVLVRRIWNCMRTKA